MPKTKLLVLLLLILVIAPLPQLGLAQDEEVINPNFDFNNIISDKDLTDYSCMNLGQIMNFLKEKEGKLDTYVDPKTRMMAAQIIYEAAITYKISPKYLLVLLQKEQSLVEDDDPTQDQFDWATGYAVCDDCSKDDPLIQKFKGFATQVNKAAWRNRYYIEHPEEFKYKVGGTYKIDSYTVTPQNQATVNLLTYTPHWHGNYNFWKIWNDWFSRSYPDGSLVQMEGEPGVWYIQKGLRRPILSKLALISRFEESKVLNISKNDLEKYEIGLPIKWPQYSLLRAPTGGVYLIVDDYKRPIISGEAFRKIGFNPDDVIDVEWAELDPFLKGEAVTPETLYPAGALLQDGQTGGVYYVENGVKYPIWAREIMKVNYPNYQIKGVKPEVLAEYLTGPVVKFKDGELIKAKDSDQIYVISNGQKLPFSSKEVMKDLGYKEENVIETSEKILNLHATGEMISE